MEILNSMTDGEFKDFSTGIGRMLMGYVNTLDTGAWDALLFVAGFSDYLEELYQRQWEIRQVERLGGSNGLDDEG